MHPHTHLASQWATKIYMDRTAVGELFREFSVSVREPYITYCTDGEGMKLLSTHTEENRVNLCITLERVMVSQSLRTSTVPYCLSWICVMHCVGNLTEKHAYIQRGVHYGHFRVVPSVSMLNNLIRTFTKSLIRDVTYQFHETSLLLSTRSPSYRNMAFTCLEWGKQRKVPDSLQTGFKPCTFLMQTRPYTTLQESVSLAWIPSVHRRYVN
jgi:hypothetical protein